MIGDKRRIDENKLWQEKFPCHSFTFITTINIQ